MKKFIVLVAFALAGLFGVADMATAAKSEINTKGPGGVFSSGKQWDYALNGYDTVAYFTEGAPVKGSAEFSSDYKGATFVFASAENKAKFDANPDQYRPQFGGYCAYAVSQGATASGDPEAWHIHEGKLYLNLNKSIQKRWLKKKEDYIVDATGNWPKVLN